MAKKIDTAANNTSIIAKCKGCNPHAFQDKKYGDKVRVFTTGRTQHCTVCGTKK